ncbi:NAD(P)/FAD-dependent oxidoreductase [Thermoanaerobacterium sp. DL9XJH110]|uniref:NAD(P)/FAD-dependent oxidoreductase n=1 Tax=Thermoanaerobacterium sp. DL9XJH110 TaxID=3386643 RepID=UPI003BB54964
MRYVVIGASAAGINAAKTLRKLDDSSDIIIISRDDRIYSRCMLHLYIGKKRSLDGLSFIEGDFFEKNKIDWIKNKSVLAVNEKSKTVTLDDGTVLPYDGLIIASGSSASIPPIKNLREAKFVYTLRNLDDAVNIDSKASSSESAVIIGGGLIGIDVASELMDRGLKVTVVEMADTILSLQLDARAAGIYTDIMRKKGAEIFTGATASEAILDYDGSFKGIKLSDGKVINGDMAVVAAGVRPNIDLIKNCGTIKVERGILVDNRCKTSDDSIYAAGDVLGRAGVWPLAVKQGITAAYNLAGFDKILDDDFGLKNSMNFFGVPTVSLGNPNPPDDSYDIDILEYENVYKKIVHKDGIICGAILQGDISYAGVLTELIKNKINIRSIPKNPLDIGFADFFHINSQAKFEYSVK